MGKYIYCITKVDSSVDSSVGSSVNSPVGSLRDFGTIGLGESPTLVTSIIYKDLAAIVSESPTKKYELSRKNLIGHQKVCEEAMKISSILPVRFATVADSEDQIVKKIFETHYEELKELLAEFDSKVELGLKVLWTNMDKVFEDLLFENPTLQKTKESLSKQDPAKTYFERADFGQKIRQALEKKKKNLSESILADFEHLSIESKELQLHGDKMILNTAFLVDQKNQQSFDVKMWAKTTHFPDLQFKYVGPLPASNFIEVVIDLEKGILNSQKTRAHKSEVEGQPGTKVG